MQPLEGLGRRVRSTLADAADRMVVMQLGGVLVERPPVLDVSAVEPRAFWAQSTVAEPRHVWVERTKDSFERGWRELDLSGESEGPGAHLGSRRLFATAHVRTGAPAAPLILMVHGFANPFTGYDRWLAWRLRRRGAHTVRLELPFHLRRAVPRARSGDHFFSLDPAHLRAVVRQSVEDTAALVAWARREVTPDVRLMGTSLGGLMVLLLSALSPMERTLAVAPLCDPAASFTQARNGPMQRYTGMLSQAAGYWGRDRDSARQALEESLAPIVARRLSPVTPPERITIVESTEDGVVGAASMEELAHAWGTHLWRYPHGHITVMNAGGLPTRVVAHLTRSAGRLGRPGLALAG